MTSNALANLRSCVKEFSLDQIEGTNHHRRWANWIENLEYCFAFEGIELEDKKKAALLALGGQALRELYKTLVEDTGSVRYKNAKKTLTDHCQGIKNLTAERYKFFCTKPISDQESHDHWVTRLKTKGRECDFDKMDLKEAIKLVVTLYTPLPKLQTAIIRDDMSFDNMMKAARAMELAEHEVEYMKSNNLEHTKAPTDDTLDLNQLSKHAERQGMRLIPKPKSSSFHPRSKMVVELC